MIDWMKWLSDNGHSIKDAAVGSAVYFLYTHFIQKKQNIIANIVGFFSGTVFSIYVSPQVQKIWATVDPNFISFIIGLLGMKLIQALIEINYQRAIEKKLNAETSDTVSSTE
jgi:hypothetical protein